MGRIGEPFWRTGDDSYWCRSILAHSTGCWYIPILGYIQVLNGIYLHITFTPKHVCTWGNRSQMFHIASVCLGLVWTSGSPRWKTTWRNSLTVRIWTLFKSGRCLKSHLIAKVGCSSVLSCKRMAEDESESRGVPGFFGQMSHWDRCDLHWWSCGWFHSFASFSNGGAPNPWKHIGYFIIAKFMWQ